MFANSMWPSTAVLGCWAGLHNVPHACAEPMLLLHAHHAMRLGGVVRSAQPVLGPEQLTLGIFYPVASSTATGSCRLVCTGHATSTMHHVVLRVCCATTPFSSKDSRYTPAYGIDISTQ